MNSIVLWPALALLAGTAVTVPVVQHSGSRTILYWFVIPSLVMGVVVLWAHGAGL